MAGRGQVVVKKYLYDYLTTYRLYVARASSPGKPGFQAWLKEQEEPTTRPEPSARDRRILELAGVPERKVAAILKAEGITCSPRTVGNVRRRLDHLLPALA
ncbi:hypothetical protein G3480_09730 [Thiorhodococcus mannitoliphagus]|uniref:Uncharacterized protein n=1 Tax=Thiorhodococcus mannitoliphagus TaxID=329406 RepID=A0A6P1DYC8_9GAMM|nr:hypothetical protein [Thiorhodococcus mannitoliphagus]NEX20585.1 hypothetical protein [Thiorhodococcus mannitoliphagus]